MRIHQKIRKSEAQLCHRHHSITAQLNAAPRRATPNESFPIPRYSIWYNSFVMQR